MGRKRKEMTKSEREYANARESLNKALKKYWKKGYAPIVGIGGTGLGENLPTVSELRKYNVHPQTLKSFTRAIKEAHRNIRYKHAVSLTTGEIFSPHYDKETRKEVEAKNRAVTQGRGYIAPGATANIDENTFYDFYEAMRDVLNRAAEIVEGRSDESPRMRDTERLKQIDRVYNKLEEIAKDKKRREAVGGELFDKIDTSRVFKVFAYEYIEYVLGITDEILGIMTEGEFNSSYMFDDLYDDNHEFEIIEDDEGVYYN